MVKMDWDRVRRDAALRGTEARVDPDGTVIYEKPVGIRGARDSATSARRLAKAQPRKKSKKKKRQVCPVCGKTKVGLIQHMTDKHSDAANGTISGSAPLATTATFRHDVDQGAGSKPNDHKNMIPDVPMRPAMKSARPKRRTWLQLRGEVLRPGDRSGSR